MQEAQTEVFDEDMRFHIQTSTRLRFLCLPLTETSTLEREPSLPGVQGNQCLNTCLENSTTFTT